MSNVLASSSSENDLRQRVGVIESGIEIPLPINQRATGISHALRQLQVGQSVILETKGPKCFHAAAFNVKIKIVIRKIEGGFYRVWRTA